jgi:hypothetical protein
VSGGGSASPPVAAGHVLGYGVVAKPIYRALATTLADAEPSGPVVRVPFSPKTQGPSRGEGGRLSACAVRLPTCNGLSPASVIAPAVRAVLPVGYGLLVKASDVSITYELQVLGAARAGHYQQKRCKGSWPQEVLYQHAL